MGGCVASQEGETILKRAPYVDVVFGPQTLHRLPKMLKDVKTHKRSQVDISFPEIEKFDHLPAPKADGVTAFVSIMEGCSKYCSFCVVPYTRGEEISRPFDDVITEIALLAEQGVREVNLLGQNVNAYRGLIHDGHIADLAILIQYMCSHRKYLAYSLYDFASQLNFRIVFIQAYARHTQISESFTFAGAKWI